MLRAISFKYDLLAPFHPGQPDPSLSSCGGMGAEKRLVPHVPDHATGGQGEKNHASLVPVLPLDGSLADSQGSRLFASGAAWTSRPTRTWPAQVAFQRVMRCSLDLRINRVHNDANRHGPLQNEKGVRTIGPNPLKDVPRFIILCREQNALPKQNHRYARLL